MKNNMKLIIYFTILLSFSLNLIQGQETSFAAYIPEQSGETVNIYTDRNLYCTNELIYFGVDYHKIADLQNLDWSNVLYVELIRWNGEKVSKTKVSLTKKGASGAIEIPGNVLSGNYYLRAYTKWMRNYSNTQYAYTLVKIINPYRSAIDPGPAEFDDIDSVNYIVSDDNFLCQTDKPLYHPRDTISVSITSKNQLITGDYYISVIKKGAVSNEFYNVDIPKNNTGKEKILTYLPDIRGISLSGKIIEKDSMQPMEEITILTSTPIEAKYLSTSISDENGMFSFTIPNTYRGSKDFFITTNIIEAVNYELLIDNDFCSKAITLPYIPFKMSEEEKTLAKEMVVNMQLSQAYLVNDTLSFDNNQVKFYGKPFKVYATQKYIDLPTVEEFINELIMEFTINTHKKQKSLKSTALTSMRYLDPLVLVDNIPVDNDEKVLQLPLKKVERIEISDKLYVIANKNYNGIINIISKNNDFAGYEIKPNSMFFTYQLISDIPDMPEFNQTGSRIPFRKNTLYWNPDFTIKKGENINFHFIASDSKGEYEILIKSKSGDKKDIYSKYKFKIE